jgi:hypothetical protein
MNTIPLNLVIPLTLPSGEKIEVCVFVEVQSLPKRGDWSKTDRSPEVRRDLPAYVENVILTWAGQQPDFPQAQANAYDLRNSLLAMTNTLVGSHIPHSLWNIPVLRARVENIRPLSIRIKDDRPKSFQQVSRRAELMLLFEECITEFQSQHGDVFHQNTDTVKRIKAMFEEHSTHLLTGDEDE